MGLQHKPQQQGVKYRRKRSWGQQKVKDAVNSFTRSDLVDMLSKAAHYHDDVYSWVKTATSSLFFLNKCVWQISCVGAKNAIFAACSSASWPKCNEPLAPTPTNWRFSLTLNIASFIHVQTPHVARGRDGFPHRLAAV